MSLRSNSYIELTNRKAVQDFIEQHHYSKSINGVISDYCFELYIKGKLSGALIYGRPAMAKQWVPYVDRAEDLIELRRLVCVDNTPKNAESYFIGATLRWLRRNTEIKKVISYADPHQGHIGIVYKASNFEYMGCTNKGKGIALGDRVYHDKAARAKYKGVLKPFAQKIKDALESGEAKYIELPGKHIYLYDLVKKT